MQEHYIYINPSHKIYRCMSALSTQQYTLLHTPIILHRKTFFASFCPPRKKILSETKLSHSSLINPRLPHTSLFTSNYNSNTNSSRKLSLLPYLGLGLGLGLVLRLGLRLQLRLRLRFCLRLQLWLWSSQPLTRYSYISLHATT